jgi:hypothetical protein
MTSKDAFTDEEWQRVRRAPMVAGLAITLADPGGPIEISKEGMASMRAATLPPTQEELLAAVALDVQGMLQRKENPVAGFKPDASTAAQAILAELTQATALVAATATPEETDAYRAWLVAAAQAAADAAKEGGFMGFGAIQVSEGEAAMLEQVREAVGAG